MRKLMPCWTLFVPCARCTKFIICGDRFLADPKDDHVLELAVASGVKTITTFNRNDFKGVEDFGVEILSPKRLLEEIKWAP
jgi:predicted nucleic acid-binding protein